jgi:hypothetical protein
VSKHVKKVSSAVGSAVKSVSSGVSKIAQGKVAEGLGDIGQTAARAGLDTVTGGNKKIADQLSGGLLTSAEMAARGNTKDITRVGAVVGATVAGGPGAGMAVNGGFAAGGFQGGLAAGLGGVGVPGAGLIAGAVSNVVGSGGGSMAPSSAPMYQAPMYSPAPVYQGTSGGINNSTMIMGAAFAGVLLILVLFLGMRRR